MKKFMTKENLIYTGVALLTAIVVYKLIEHNRNALNSSSIKPASKSTEETTSDFCGCGA